MDQYELAPPFFESDREKDTFTAYFLFHHLLSAGDLAWLDGFRIHNLTSEEQKALVYVREIGALNNALYRAINHVEAQSASRDLHRLRDLGLLRQRGQGRGTYYTPTRTLQGTFPDALAPREPSELEAKPSELEAKPSELGAEPSELEAKPSEPRGASDEPSAARRSEGASDAFADLPQDLLVAVAQLAGRASESKIRGVLLRLCGARSDGRGAGSDRRPESRPPPIPTSPPAHRSRLSAVPFSRGADAPAPGLSHGAAH
jgi:ATP-dependent DNA helicase RecG